IISKIRVQVNANKGDLVNIWRFPCYPWLMIIINFKDYDEATGENAKKLAKIFEKVAVETGAMVAVAVHPTDLRAVVAEVTQIPVFSQSGDSYTGGAGQPKKTQTGRMTPNIIKKIGAKGILVNHAENPRSNEEIRSIIEDFKAECPEIKIVVCAESVERAQGIVGICGAGAAGTGARAPADFIAIEPPDMIGGDVSVTTKPEVIKDAVEKIGDNVLVGAGVKTGDDVKEALRLGAKGVLLASGVIKPKDGKTPEEALRSLCESSKGINQINLCRRFYILFYCVGGSEFWRGILKKQGSSCPRFFLYICGSFRLDLCLLMLLRRWFTWWLFGCSEGCCTKDFRGKIILFLAKLSAFFWVMEKSGRMSKKVFLDLLCRPGLWS
ncbi:MAG: triose-phosphate isomerase, partial [Candidatus Gracilibacteria bacterium]